MIKHYHILFYLYITLDKFIALVIKAINESFYKISSTTAKEQEPFYRIGEDYIPYIVELHNTSLPHVFTDGSGIYVLDVSIFKEESKAYIKAIQMLNEEIELEVNTGKKFDDINTEANINKLTKQKETLINTYLLKNETFDKSAV